jgi:hypothetical protein
VCTVVWSYLVTSTKSSSDLVLDIVGVLPFNTTLDVAALGNHTFSVQVSNDYTMLLAVNTTWYDEQDMQYLVEIGSVAHVGAAVPKSTTMQLPIITAAMSSSNHASRSALLLLLLLLTCCRLRRYCNHWWRGCRCCDTPVRWYDDATLRFRCVSDSSWSGMFALYLRKARKDEAAKSGTDTTPSVQSYDNNDAAVPDDAPVDDGGGGVDATFVDDAPPRSASRRKSSRRAAEPSKPGWL